MEGGNIHTWGCIIFCCFGPYRSIGPEESEQSVHVCLKVWDEDLARLSAVDSSRNFIFQMNHLGSPAAAFTEGHNRQAIRRRRCQLLLRRRSGSCSQPRQAPSGSCQRSFASVRAARDSGKSILENNVLTSRKQGLACRLMV